MHVDFNRSLKGLTLSLMRAMSGLSQLDAILGNKVLIEVSVILTAMMARHNRNQASVLEEIETSLKAKSSLNAHELSELELYERNKREVTLPTKIKKT